ncbi:MAG: DUF2079 domain-containing protein [Ktedonobacteraceae bacterium]|nr:DUF2079 domain-containing protein [Ktedonobacteraceae bacterium]
MIKRFRLSTYLSLIMQQRLAWILLVAVMVAYTLWMSDQALLRYATFKATAFDLGNMDQAVWNTLHGHPFEFTNRSDNYYGAPIRLAQHVEPILLLLAPLYLFHADARILLVFQTLAVAAGALPTFLLTRKYLPTLPLLAPVMAAAYLFAPASIGQNIYDFHPVTLAAPLLLFAILALTYRRIVWFLVACILAASCKEEMPLVVAMLGVLVAWKYKLPRLGLLLFIGGIVLSAIAFLVIEPHFNVGAKQNTYWYRYAALGSSPKAAIVNVLLHPWLPLVLFVTFDRVYYLFSLMRSGGFLALLAPEWLLPTLPSLAINLLSIEVYQHSGVYQYNAAIIPFVVVAAIHGARRLYLLWYGWRDEDDGLLYREESVLNTDRYAAGRPIPGTLAVANALSSGYARVRRGVAEVLLWRRSVGGGKGKGLWRSVPWRRGEDDNREGLWLREWSGREQMVDLARVVPVPFLQWIMTIWIVGMIVLNIVIMTPWLNIFWADHRPGDREQHIEQVLALIPPDASVSAGGNLNPHLSDRRYVTVFPEIRVAALGDKESRTVDYLIVDLDNASPENKDFSANYVDVLNQLQRSKQFRLIAQAEGVLLLERVKM